MMAVPEMTIPPLPIRATPYRHQMEAYCYACGLFGLPPGGTMQSRGCALLMEMGTGKTITSIAITGALSNAGRIRRALIVIPTVHPRRMGGGISKVCRLPVCAGCPFWHRQQEARYPAPHDRSRSAGGRGEL